MVKRNASVYISKVIIADVISVLQKSRQYNLKVDLLGQFSTDWGKIFYAAFIHKFEHI